jgi:hypothetical protein
MHYMFDISRIRRYGKHIILLSIMMTPACSVSLIQKYEGIRPVNPKPLAFNAVEQSPVVVGTVSPTFSWEEKNGVENYDLKIWKAIQTKMPGSSTYVLGGVVFSRENINSTSYTLPIKLEQDTIYYWSVKQSKSTNWSFLYTEYNNIFPGRSGKRKDFYIFATPPTKNE